ncbi:MAG: four helix bundle protein [Fibrobacteria bacterium]|nr:four helix bundle protein [Fibrobacteria bacterium]
MVKLVEKTVYTKQKPYDLEDRTYRFAVDVRTFLRSIPNNIEIMDDKKQVLRSSGSIGANYIEANECLGKKDFLMRIKISRKEAKESNYWLRLMAPFLEKNIKSECEMLIQESREITHIFGAILEKSK